MIKLESKYDEQKDTCSIKANIKNTNTYEHLYAIAYLVEKITENDEFTPYDEIIRILNELFKKKEGKKNGRNKK